MNGAEEPGAEDSSFRVPVVDPRRCSWDVEFYDERLMKMRSASYLTFRLQSYFLRHRLPRGGGGYHPFQI